MTEMQSIFARYYSDEPFVDRYASNADGAVDVIIPVLYSNELWKKNLISIYREVPVRRLILGDGGCKDDTLVIARQFPRLKICDHAAYKSLGYSIKELIKAVDTEWFLYLHSDVYLPAGWFDIMRAHQQTYDWFGCPMRITALVEYPLIDRVRPYAGSQMGRKAAFAAGLDKIDDDYVYRQEDWVFARIVEDAGFRHGRIEDTFHWHQMMPRLYGDDRRVRKFKGVKIDAEMTGEEEFYTADTQLRGTIKYLHPDSNQVSGARENLSFLRKTAKLDLNEFNKWVARTNPEWLPHLRPRSGARSELQWLLQRPIRKFFPKIWDSWERRRLSRVAPSNKISPRQDEVQLAKTFVMSVIQYMDPYHCQDLVPELNEKIAFLLKLRSWDGNEFARWIAKINPAWSPLLGEDKKCFMTAVPTETVESDPNRVLGVDSTIFLPAVWALAARYMDVPLFRVMYWRLWAYLRPGVVDGQLDGVGRAANLLNRTDWGARPTMAARCRTMAAAFERLASQLEE
jgi:hypothetical protein